MPPKEFNVTLDIFGSESDKIGYNIESVTGKRLSGSLHILDVALQRMRAGRQRYPGGPSPVEDEDFISQIQCPPHTGCRYIASTADKESLHKYWFSTLAIFGFNNKHQICPKLKLPA